MKDPHIDEWNDAMGIEGLLLLEPRELFDPCLIGVASQAGGVFAAIYDEEALVKALQATGMSHEDAVEHYCFNVSGGYVGKSTPLFLVWRKGQAGA